MTKVYLVWSQGWAEDDVSLRGVYLDPGPANARAREVVDETRATVEDRSAYGLAKFTVYWPDGQFARAVWVTENSEGPLDT